MEVLKLTIVLSFLFCWVGCGGSKFVVKSDPPQADVFFIDVGSGEKKSLGKTPLEMPTEELKNTIGGKVSEGEFFVLGIEQAGFLTEKFTIPLSTFGAMVTSLDIKLNAGDQAKEELVAKEIIDRLFVAQKFALLQQFERAHIELDKIIAVMPTFSRALSMRASIYFAQQNYAESLKWYEEALKADPQMEETVKMVSKVRELMGGQQRLPASPTAPTPPPGVKK